MDFITPKHELKEEALRMSIFLQTELETAPEDLKLHADEIEMKGNQLAIYLARSGDMLADSKYHLAQLMKTDVLKQLLVHMEATYLSASSQKEFIRSAVPEDTWLVDRIERLNRSLVHQLDWYRSVLSKYKEELRLQGYGT